MNRIELFYNTESEPHSLEVRNNMKGYINETLLVVFGRSADMLFELLKNVDYSKLENYMRYGVYVKRKKGNEWKGE